MKILSASAFQRARPAGLALAALLLAQLACASPQAQSVIVVTATPQPTQPPQSSPIVLVVTATPAPVQTQPAQTALPVSEAAASATPTQAAPTPATVQPTKPLKPSPTPLVLRSARIEGDQNKIRAQFLFPDLQAGGDSLFFQVQARNPQVGKQDGAGINNVEFSITDDNGNEVYHRVEKTPHYCSFGGGEPACNLLRLTHGQVWPGTTTPVQDGHYTITATIHAADGNEWSGSVEFDIYLQ